MTPNEQRLTQALLDLRAKLQLVASKTLVLSPVMMAETLTLMTIDIDKALDEP